LISQSRMMQTVSRMQTVSWMQTISWMQTRPAGKPARSVAADPGPIILSCEVVKRHHFHWRIHLYVEDSLLQRILPEYSVMAHCAACRNRYIGTVVRSCIVERRYLKGERSHTSRHTPDMGFLAFARVYLLPLEESGG